MASLPGRWSNSPPTRRPSGRCWPPTTGSRMQPPRCRAVIAAGVIPAALEMMDQKMTTAVERFVEAGFPTDAAAVLLAEVTGHPAAVDAEAELVRTVARSEPCDFGSAGRRRSGAGPALEGAQGGLWRRCPNRSRLLPPRHRGAAHQTGRGDGDGLRDRRSLRPDHDECVPCRRRQPPPTDGI